MKDLREDLRVKTIKVSGKGQIAIPSDIRKEMDIRKGQDLLLMKKGDRLLIEKPSRIQRR